MRRRDFITGASALATYAALPKDAAAITRDQRATLLGGASNGPTVRQVATRAFVAGVAQGSANHWMSRTFHFMRGNSPTLQLVYTGWYVNGATFVETNAGFDQVITASIEYPAGTFTQVKFSGSATGTIPNGGQLISDPVTAPPQGQQFWVRRWNSTAGTILFPNNGAAISFYPANGDALAISASDQTLSGTVTDGGFGAGAPFPQAIIGNSSTPCAAVLGDSRAFGWGDTTSPNASGDIGDIARSIGPNYPYLIMATPGQKTSDFLTNASKQLVLMKYGTWMMSEFGINDVSGGANLATVQSRLQTLWALWPNSNRAQNTLEPLSTSTDSWATLANQTTAAQNAVRTGLNDWLRLLPTGIKKCFDVASAVESSLDSGKWNCPVAGGGTAAAVLTADGIHPNTTGYNLIKTSAVIPSNALG